MWAAEEHLKEMQLSKNLAKESCVAASASVADIKSLVTVRVGARLNLWSDGTVCSFIQAEQRQCKINQTLHL